MKAKIAQWAWIVLIVGLSFAVGYIVATGHVEQKYAEITVKHTENLLEEMTRVWHEHAEDKKQMRLEAEEQLRLHKFEWFLNTAAPKLAKLIRAVVVVNTRGEDPETAESE